MAISSITVQGITIETTQDIASILPVLLMQEAPKAAKVESPKVVATATAPKAPRKTTPKVAAPKVKAEATVFDRKVEYRRIMELAKVNPADAKAEAAKLGWVQVVETIDRRFSAKPSKSTTTAKPSSKKPQQPKAESVIEAAPPKAEQRKASRTARKAKVAKVAEGEAAGKQRLQEELATLTPKVEREARKESVKTDWQARRTARHGEAACLGCMSDITQCICKSSTKCSAKVAEGFAAAAMAPSMKELRNEYPALSVDELRSLAELKLALEALDAA